MGAGRSGIKKTAPHMPVTGGFLLNNVVSGFGGFSEPLNDDVPDDQSVTTTVCSPTYCLVL